MVRKRVSGYGTWTSPLTAARVTAGALRFEHLVSDGDDLYWAEGRASEGGRVVVVRRAADGSLHDATPSAFNVRTRVHEYGGAAYTVYRGVVYFSNFSDQRLYRQAPGQAPEPIAGGRRFYADAHVDERRGRLIAVCEDHTAPGEPVNTLAAVSLDGGHEEVLVAGADFYSNPALSPDGSRLAWLQWNHPHMPWDSTELWVGTIGADGTVGDRTRVAGGNGESIWQPLWSPGGDLFYVSDRTGFWNLHVAGSPDPLWQMEADFGKPQWIFGQRTYCVLDSEHLVAAFTEHGRWALGLLRLAPVRFDRIDLAIEPTDGIIASPQGLFVLGGSPTHPMCVARIDLPSGHVEVVRLASSDRVPEEWISAAEPITFASNGRPVHAFYYAPRNPECEAPSEEAPPLIVLGHGGPTSAATDILDLRVQFWTSRGFAVLDVNYSGSSGFGRAYRDRLRGEWGVADVADCVNAARHLVDAGLADPKRLIIRGGSAGGYTTLAALTFHDCFTAGASYYGVSDLEVLARETHKFESRYLEWLVGPYPEARDLYRARSPIHFADRLSAALILFQGLEDRIVPPNQAEMMAEAARRKGLPVAYLAFEGEQHGFRKAENIIRVLEAELFFYGAVFGFTPADPIPPVAIDNLRR